MSRRPAMALLRAFALASACAPGAGCTTVGNGSLIQLDAAAATATLVPGRSTQADVRAALGQGKVIHFQSGYETWHYFYKQGLAKGWDDVPYIGLITSRIAGATKELVILFDETGTLKRFSLQEEPVERKP